MVYLIRTYIGFKCWRLYDKSVVLRFVFVKNTNYIMRKSVPTIRYTKEKKIYMEREDKKINLTKIKKKIIAVSVFIAIILLIAIGVYMKMVVFNNKEGQVSTISKSSLEKIVEINELSTVDYTYNATTKVYDEDGTTIKYYVAYEGVVTAGIDFKKIKIVPDEEQKKIVITLPEIEIHVTDVNMGTLDYIFMKDKYETETVSQEAYKACKQDLENRVKNETDLIKMAKTNAIESVKALFTPWIQQVDEEYEVEVK